MMPISPSDRRENLKNLFSDSIESHCKMIDAALCKSFTDECWYSTRGMSPYVISQIKSLYESSGWDVRVVYDQRDGDALVFKERK